MELNEIKSDISVGRPIAAKRLAQEILARCRVLAQNPSQIRMVYESDDPAFREAFIRHYRIVIEVVPEGIRVLKVEYSRRNREPISKAH